jgi:replicative DNA helicase
MANPNFQAVSSDPETSRIKVPPHSVEAEQAVLGGLMLDNRRFDEISEIISAVDFYRQDHRLIFGAAERLAGESEPLDVVTLAEFLDRAGDIEDAGGLSYLAELAEKTPGAANIRAYADIVRERSILRQLVEVSGKIADSAFNPQGRNSNEVLDAAERNVFQIAESRVKEGTGPQTINPILTKALGRIEALFESGETTTGLTTGFKDLDEWTSGMQPSDLLIVAGRPSMGKTAFTLTCARNAVLYPDESMRRNVAIFSLEMSSQQLVQRFLTMEARIDAQQARTGKLNDEDFKRLIDAASRLFTAKIFIDDTPGLSLMELRTKCRRLKSEHDIGLIVVDYLQLMTANSKDIGSREQEIATISRGLKGLAKELSVPVIALSQLSRQVEQRGGDKRPQLSDLRESGSIEQDADVVCFLYRPEYYGITSTAEGQSTNGLAELIIGKQRNGPVGTTNMYFVKQYARFEKLTHSDDPMQNGGNDDSQFLPDQQSSKTPPPTHNPGGDDAPF